MMENEREQSEFEQMVTAVQANEARTVKLLLEKGQNQMTLNSSLCWASRLGNLPLVILLVEFGADPNAQVWGGFTSLLWATIFTGNLSVIRFLISSGAVVNHCSKKRRQTTLHAAIIKGEVEVAECLINAGAILDVQDYLCKTPLLHATQRNLLGCVKLLIHHNCNVNLAGFVNGTSLSPLLVALLQNNLEITKMLILAGARFEQTAIYQTYTIRQYYRTVEDNLNMELRPVYLKQQCRVCIRQILKAGFLQKLKEIDLPPSLRDFLSMAELNSMI